MEKRALPLACFIFRFLRRPHDQHMVLMIGRSLFSEDENTSRNTSTIKQILGNADNRFNAVFFKKLGAYFAFGSATK